MTFIEFVRAFSTVYFGNKIDISYREDQIVFWVLIEGGGTIGEIQTFSEIVRQFLVVVFSVTLVQFNLSFFSLNFSNMASSNADRYLDLTFFLQWFDWKS